MLAKPPRHHPLGGRPGSEAERLRNQQTPRPGDTVGHAARRVCWPWSHRLLVCKGVTEGARASGLGGKVMEAQLTARRRRAFCSYSHLWLWGPKHQRKA